MATDFESLLNQRTTDAKPPRPLPAGPYRMETRGMEFSKSQQKGTPSIRIAVCPLEALEGVNMEEMTDVELGKRTLNLDYYITEDATYRFVEFGKSCQVEDVENLTIKELAAKFKSSRFQFVGYIVHTPNKNAQSESDPKFYANVGRTAKL